MSFPPFILLRFTVNKRLEPCTLTTAVQPVVEPCDIAVYSHSTPLRCAYVQSGLATLLDGGQALVVDVGFQKLLQLPQAVGDPGHQVVHPSQVCPEQGGSKLCDWLPQKGIETKKTCIALLQTLLQGELKSPAERAGLPGLEGLTNGSLPWHLTPTPPCSSLHCKSL